MTASGGTKHFDEASLFARHRWPTASKQTIYHRSINMRSAARRIIFRGGVNIAAYGRDALLPLPTIRG